MSGEKEREKERLSGSDDNECGENERRVRTKDVQDWQLAYGMQPREDSKLTDLYARGLLDAALTADSVARELVATDFLYKNTLYPEILEDFLRGVANRCKRENPSLTWNQVWEIVRFYGPDVLKLMMCTHCCVTIPETRSHHKNDSCASSLLPTVVSTSE